MKVSPVSFIFSPFLQTATLMLKNSAGTSVSKQYGLCSRKPQDYTEISASANASSLVNLLHFHRRCRDSALCFFFSLQTVLSHDAHINRAGTFLYLTV